MKSVTRAILFLLITSFGIASHAQETTQAGQHTSSDGRLSIQYPSDWVLREDETITLASSAAALQASDDGDLLALEDMVFSIVLPTQLPDIGLDVTDDAMAVIESLIDITEVTGDVAPYLSVAIPAANATVENDDVMYGQLVGLQFDAGVVVVAIEFGADPANYADTVAQILGGISYDGQSAEDGRGIETIRQWATGATGTSQYGTDGWSFMQATGEPNTTICGDHTTAWASSGSRGVDSITLEFAQLVFPTQINVYQTYNPGSIKRIELRNSQTNDVFEVPNSADSASTPCPGVFTVNLSDVKKPFNSLTLYLDQSQSVSWNEIDAVELVGTNRKPASGLKGQWAVSASGTSQFGTDSWSFKQATGEPNVTGCGDNVQAWASSSRTGKDSLTLEFAEAVIPSQINIHQTYTPGSITHIELGNTETSTITAIPDSDDPPGNTPCPGVFTLNVSGVKTPVNSLTIYFDQSIGGNWNEIDAVELIGAVPGGLTRP